jgi:hypothetical protein
MLGYAYNKWIMMIHELELHCFVFLVFPWQPIHLTTMVFKADLLGWSPQPKVRKLLKVKSCWPLGRVESVPLDSNSSVSLGVPLPSSCEM